MAGIIPVYPLATPHTAGDPIAWRVHIETAADISTWQWAAVVRRYENGPIVARFDIDPDPDDDHGLILRMDEATSDLLRHGMGFDLRQTFPLDWTYVTVKSLNISPSYSYEPPVSV
jgi:hypothetical protein